LRSVVFWHHYSLLLGFIAFFLLTVPIVTATYLRCIERVNYKYRYGIRADQFFSKKND